MAREWYILSTYSGYENKIEKHIRKFMEDPSFAEIVLDIKVPTEEVIEVKDGKKKTVKRKFLPGYVLLEMDLSETNWKEPCSRIKRIDGASGFVGVAGNKKPCPIPAEEAKAILQKTGEIKADKHAKFKQTFDVDEKVKIIDGAFTDFEGVVEEVNIEKGKIRVVVSIFGRPTPVELDFAQVEKI